MIPVLFYIVFGVFSLGLISCDGESVRIVQGPTPSIAQVDAHFYEQFFGVGTPLKSDTLEPGDSIYLTANIQPSRSIRMQRYFWMVDTAKHEQVFNFRASFTTGGLHLASFHLIDYFGDTLSDTVRIWVSESPRWGALFLPQDSSWGVQPFQPGTLFSWECHDFDPTDTLQFRLMLYQEDSLLVDTTLYNTSFEYPQPLAPLSLYRWRVYAYDSYGMTPSTPSIHHSFTTLGLPHESGILAPQLSQSAFDTSTILQCQNSIHSIVYSAKAQRKSPRLSPLPPGNYRCWAYNTQWTDWQTDTLTLTLQPGQFMAYAPLVFSDSTAPVIVSFDSSPVLPAQQNLLFQVQDGAPGNVQVKVWWNGAELSTWKFENHILTITPPTLPQAPSIQSLVISATDAALNTQWKTFSVEAP